MRAQLSRPLLEWQRISGRDALSLSGDTLRPSLAYSSAGSLPAPRSPASVLLRDAPSLSPHTPARGMSMRPKPPRTHAVDVAADAGRARRLP